jgi:hypothetical protein
MQTLYDEMSFAMTNSPPVERANIFHFSVGGASNGRWQGTSPLLSLLRHYAAQAIQEHGHNKSLLCLNDKIGTGSHSGDFSARV